MHQCQQVGLEFINQAQVVESNSTILNASARSVFELFSEADKWPRWYPGMNKVTWTSPRPFGVGTTRTVALGPLKAYEHFFLWEEDHRFAFCFTGTNLPFVTTLVEEYKLIVLTENSCEFTYTVAYNPALPVRLTGPIGKATLANVFKRATRSLKKYIDTQT